MSVSRYNPKTPPPKPGGTTRFEKGQARLPNAGRKLGQPNKTTKLLKDAISGSAEQLGMLEPIYRMREVKIPGRRTPQKQATDEIIGWKPTGEGGTQGFLVWLGCHYPRSYAALLSRLLPVQVNAKVGGNLTVTEAFRGRDIKSMTLAEKMAAMKEVIGLTRPLALPDDSNTIEGEFVEADAE
jgi:hypothetical protein